MADDAATSAEESQITFNVKSANDQKFVITIPATASVLDLKTKLATPDFADIPTDRQRLIYSGRVLKDPDTLASAKIKDGHTVHLVKGAASNARQNPTNQGAASSSGGASAGGAAAQVPTNLATGVGNNPLAGLTGARYAGFHGLPGADMFGPDGGMGPPPDSESLLQMMDNPMFLSQMNEAMNNPAVIEMMTQNPMIRDNPMLAEMIRNPEMRRMMFNPEMMRMQLQMQRAMDNQGARFTAPGVTDTTPQPGSTATGDGTTATPNQPNTTGPTNPSQDPFAALLGGAGGAGAGGANPFGALFGPGGANPFAAAQPGAGAGATPSGNTEGSQNPPASSSPPPNPFAMFGQPPAAGGAAAGQHGANPIAEMTRQLMQNPEAMRSAMQMMNQMNPGGAGAAANPFAAFAPPTGAAGSPPAANANPFAALFGPGGGFGAPAAPVVQDTRPPEVVYENQLRQLNEMGFFEFERNVSALRRSGGNVQGAIEFLLGGE
ncbi:hypothetical protein BCR34DRAFT_477426 [Clohesyomyces aquaticus]|uniref:Uncharacterized protein n=1 Tax=Clohesyomyces aquaticus TaxID=1231657 RepID=A0A1Y1ZZK2_9PLEO|nr:hypothetical protein BCR34DRAFT_477426 [Clohesyomyces aquaticus]